MRKTLFVLIFIFLHQFVISQSSWFFQNPNVLNQLNSIYYVNLTTGYIVGEAGCILKTTNQGNSWNNLSISNQYYFWDTHFINENTGTAVGGYSSYTSLIMRTTNGGLNWVQQTSNANVHLRSVWFIDVNTGIAVGEFGGSNGKLIRTTNQGNNWTLVSFNTAYTGFNCVRFVNNQTGFVTSNWGIFKSTDLGLTWNQQFSLNNYLMSVHFINEYTGYCCGYNGFLRKTTNGGTNWIVLNTGTANNFYDIHFKNINTGTIIGASGMILHTTNGGSNWINQSLQGVTYLKSIFYINGDTATAVGKKVDSMSRGTVIKTFTDGTVDVKTVSTNVPQMYSLSQNYPNPFNPSTTIEFDIPKSEVVSLSLYDITGRFIEVLQNGTLSPGRYSVSWDGSNYSSGIYFYTLKTESFTQTKRMVLVK